MFYAVLFAQTFSGLSSLWFFVLNLKPPIDPPPTTQINYCRVSNFASSTSSSVSFVWERESEEEIVLSSSPRKLLLVIEFPSNPLREHVLLHFAKLEQHRISCFALPLSFLLSSPLLESRRCPFIPNSFPFFLLIVAALPNFVKFQISLICCPKRIFIYPIPYSCNYYF